MTIPKPSASTSLGPITAALDAASHDERVAYIRSLGGKEQLKLYALAQGNPVSVKDITGAANDVVICEGRNGLAMFNRFQKRFSHFGTGYVGYNHNPGFVSKFSGPGHFVAYDAEEAPGEVWIDYRRLPTEQHPDFPPLIDNDHGIRALIFGNMVDRLRRVSQHVFIGNAYKDMPALGKMTLAMRVGKLMGTAPFALAMVPADAS